MTIEHIALNVKDPVAMTAWYEQHLGMRAISRMTEAPYTHFLGDSALRGMLEIYNNPKAAVPDYKNMDPLLLHVAFDSTDPTADSARLCKAGATPLQEVRMPDGTHVITIRDPWGLAIQFCKRAKSLR